MSWRLSRLRKKEPREQRRLRLLRAQVDLQLLRLKLLDERALLLEEGLWELQASQRFRLRGELEPPPEKTELDLLLGL